MTARLPLLNDDELTRLVPSDDSGFGMLRTDKGPLPLKAMEVEGRIDGLLAQLSIRQTYVNTHDVPIEATYIFPLPDRAAVTRFRMEVGNRVVEGQLKERGQARADYDEALAAGHRAAITEEERPGVFTIRLGNLMPGEEAVVSLSLAGPLPYCDGEVTFRFPLVVAPRYIPGVALSGPSVGDGTASDTDAVPDASRITPPVLLPGFPNPVRLAIGISVHGSGLPVRDLRSSLHAAVTPQADGAERVVVEPGERLNRDFILRFRLGSNAISTALSVHPDPGTDGSAGGTFALTIVPPSGIETNTRPRDVVFVIDRSGSMEGWKMVAARRALARMVDALNDHDRFTLLAFDTTVETPRGFDGASLCAATDRNRFRAVEYLAQLEARGGTEMADPLDKAAKLLSSRAGERDRVLVFVTDGQVGNEDQLLRLLGKRLSGIRFFALGVDTAVNEAFLRRLVALGEGSCECVESEDRLDEVMTSMHRRIDAPLLNGLKIEAAGLQALQDTIVPSRMSDLFAGAPLLVMGRYQGQPAGAVSVQATDAQGRTWSETVQAVVRENPAIVSVWARGRIRELEDLYVVSRTNRESLERQVTTTSLAYGILCRFTAYVAVDTQQVVNEGGEVHQIVQPVEVPQGWEDRSLTRSTWAPVMHAARASHGFARGAMAYSAPESSDSVDSVCDRAMPTGIWASLSAMDGPPPPTRSAKGAAGSRGEDSLPHASRRMRSMNWRRIKAALGWGSAASGALPDGLNLPECRRFADAVLEHLIDVLSNQGRGRLKALRALAKQLLELSQRLKVVGAPEAEVQAFVELHAELEALPKRKVPPPAQAAALCAKVEGIRQALLAQAGPSSGTTGERGQSFWK